MNNTKRKFNEVLDHIKSRLDAKNIMSAREEILAEIKYWNDEANQMMIDRENRMISVALFFSGVLSGLLIGALLF